MQRVFYMAPILVTTEHRNIQMGELVDLIQMVLFISQCALHAEEVSQPLQVPMLRLVEQPGRLMDVILVQLSLNLTSKEL